MKNQLKKFADDTHGMVSIDWIGLAAGVAISASSLVSYIGDHVTDQSQSLNTSIHDASLCPDELHVAHKDNNLETVSHYYPPHP